MSDEKGNQRPIVLMADNGEYAEHLVCGGIVHWNQGSGPCTHAVEGRFPGVQSDGYGGFALLIVNLYSSSLPFLEWVRNTVERLVGLRCNVNAVRPGYGSLTYSGRKAVSLLRWIYYKSSLPCLTRKRDVFETYVRSKY